MVTHPAVTETKGPQTLFSRINLGKLLGSDLFKMRDP